MKTSPANLSLLTFLSILLAFSRTALAEPIVEEKILHYDISGSTAVELRQSLSANSNIELNKQTFDALTQWRVEWNYTWQNGPNGCAISHVATEVDITYTMPRWPDAEQGKPSLRERWRIYIAALTFHEKGHGNNGIRAAREIEQTIRNMRPRANCELLEQDANKIGFRVVDEYADIDREYDRYTNHGATQGARFP